MQKNLPWGTSARGTGTWQQQPSANGCQVPVPLADVPWQIQLFSETNKEFNNNLVVWQVFIWLFGKYSFGILIHSFILFNQSHKLFERLYPIEVKFPCIVKLTLLLHPIQHIMLFYPMLRRIAMIGFNKINHLLVSCKPTCLLIHNFCVSPHQSFFRGILGKFFKSQIPCNPPILWEFQTFSELIYGEKHDFYGEFTNQCFRGYLQYNT